MDSVDAQTGGNHMKIFPTGDAIVKKLLVEQWCGGKGA